MSFSELRGQFTIFLFLQSVDLNMEIKATLTEAGYDSYVFADQETLIHRVREAAPHILLFSPEALQTSLSDFVAEVLAANPEVQFICQAPADQADALMEYREYNFIAHVPEGEKWAQRCLWEVDQACEAIYRIYQNEELLEQTKQVGLLQEQLKGAEALLPLAQENSLAEVFQKYQGLTSKEDYINTFLRGLPCKAIYFKYLPTVSSFVAMAAHGLDIESIKGVGSRMTKEEAKDVIAFLASGKVPQSLDELMSQGLKVPQYFSQAVPIHHGLDGLMIFWGDESFHFKKIENDFYVFLMLFQQAHLIKKYESVDVHDPVTELFNRNYFYQKLEEEIARSRRLKKPISVVRLEVDQMMEIEQSLGRNNRDLILRAVGSLIKKTSRVNDISSRSEENAFSMILPHCARKGAALRAERLRRIIEAHDFGIANFKVTVSCGVSEYPSLSKGAEDLDLSAGKALEFIMSRGGNKVCLYKPMEEFQPDFEVPP